MITQEQKQEIMIYEEVFRTEHKLSKNDVAEKSGVSARYLIAMREGIDRVESKEGKKTEITDKYYKKLADFMGMPRSRYWCTQTTDQYNEIKVILNDARDFAYTNVIIGETGCGKSYTVAEFAKQHPKDVFVVTVSKVDSISGILNRILNCLKIPPAVTKSERMQDIIKVLCDKKLDGDKPVLIFDECEYMRHTALCVIKELYDGLKGECGLVLVGHPQLMTTIDRLRKCGKDGIPQLYRRIKFGIRYLPNIDSTVSFNLFTEGLDRHLQKFLHKECENYGELHDVLVPAMREAERMGEDLTVAFVKMVLNIN
jgi:DNA transposition AAA+ family ATPase